MRSDIVVVGGGPAGAALAALAADAGAAVTLVERKRFPRDKLCGGFVAGAGVRVLEGLGLADALVASGARVLAGVRLTSRDGRALDVPLPPGAAALGVSRGLLDRMLLDRARAAGARVLEGREALDVERDGGDRVRGVVVREVGHGGRQTLEAPLVVAADGRRSRIARLVHTTPGDPGRTVAGSRFALQSHLAAPDPTAADRIELHLFAGGYAGIAPIEGDRLNLCFLFHARELRAVSGSPERMLDELVRDNPAADRALRGARPAGRWHAVGPLRFGPRAAAARGVLFVGDAAGTVDPFAGTGIAHALVAAERATPHALRAAERGGLDLEGERDWAEAWSARFARPTRRLRRLGRLLERPPLAELALRALGRGDGAWVRRIVAATQRH
jgi:geranylgeranyl reductase family protein